MPDWAVGGAAQIGMLVVGIKFFIKPVRNPRNKILEENPKKRVIKAITGGIIVGFICGFVGAGGGMMLLFVLTTFLGYEMHMAVGTSVFIMTFTALTGGISHIVIGGWPDIACLLLCVVFTFLWARIAAVLANKAEAITLNRMVGIIMMLTSLVILRKR